MPKQLITAMICTLLCITPAIAQRAFAANARPAAHAIDGVGIWSHASGNNAHNAVPHSRPISLAAPVWTNSSYLSVPQSGVVADSFCVYAICADPASPTQHAAVTYNRFTGDIEWAQSVPAPIFDSWSTPTIDPINQSLIVASGSALTALDTDSGDLLWSTDIGGIIVNASPTLSNDLGSADRVFITNYSFGGGSAAKLTCINTDLFDADTNPYQPGEIVWQTPINGDSSGNTPAYSKGVVYVGAASTGSGSRGKILAFDATSTTPPSPLWSFTNTINAGFFGGVCIARGHLYASSYSFTGLQTSANTVKLDKRTGELVWSVPSNRTDATPIVLPNGLVVVSAGVPTAQDDVFPFFGTLPSIELIEDLDDHAQLLWDSALSTHDDLNSNGFWDSGEPFMSIGGWTHLPIALTIEGTPHLLVSTQPESTITTYINHSTDLRLIDLSLDPTDPAFVVEHYEGSGDSPAYVSGWVYSAGSTGISAFSPTARIKRTQSLVDRYTNGTITLKQLLERLPR